MRPNRPRRPSPMMLLLTLDPVRGGLGSNEDKVQALDKVESNADKVASGAATSPVE